MFLKSITINNYKSIQKATVGFENGLNIIIGKNGAGKSNLLEFIYDSVFFYTVAGRFSRNANLEYEFTVNYYDGLNPTEVTIYLKREKIVLKGEIELSNEIKVSKSVNEEFPFFEKAIKYTENDKKVKNDNELNDLLREVQPVMNFHREVVLFKFSDNPYWLSQPKRYELDTELFPDTQWQSDGFELLFELDRAIVLEFSNQKSLKFENVGLSEIKKLLSETFNDFNEKYQLMHNLSKFSPIQDVKINPNINIYNVGNKILIENLLLDFKVNDKWMPWGFLSDGTKRLFYLITQCLSIDNGLVLIEEPELGVHPHQLYSLMNFLKEQSYYKQIIISTHSPVVLDILSGNELDRIITARITKEGTQFTKLSEEKKETAKRYMEEVGDLSYYWLHSDLEDE